MRRALREWFRRLHGARCSFCGRTHREAAPFVEGARGGLICSPCANEAAATIYRHSLQNRKVVATVSPLGGAGAAYEALFTIDNFAIDCLAPRSALIAAGIHCEGRRRYTDSEKDREREYGFARIRVGGVETVTQVVFGEENDEPLLGCAALASLGLGVDPATNAIERVEAKPLRVTHRSR